MGNCVLLCDVGEYEGYCISFKDERAIQRQLPKVLLVLPMIGVPDGRMGGSHS